MPIPVTFAKSRTKEDSEFYRNLLAVPATNDVAYKYAVGQNEESGAEAAAMPVALKPQWGSSEAIKRALLDLRSKKSSPKEKVDSMSEETKQANEREIMGALSLKEVPGRTHIIAIVLDQGDADRGELPRNSRAAIRCHHGAAFSEGYPYDQGSDSYMIPCAYHNHLGHVPISYVLEMPNAGAWSVRVPLPESVVNRYLSSQQKAKLTEIQAKYPQPRYVIQIMQMSGCET